MVSNDGNVIGRIVSYANRGYGSIGIKRRNYYVHRLVYELFVGPIKKGMQINHKNGIKSDNRIENLEAVTRSENVKHAFRIGLNKPSRYPGKSNPNYRNGVYLGMTHNEYKKAWGRASYRGLDWKSMSLEERYDLLNG